MGCFSGSESKSESKSYLPAQEKWLTKALDLYGKQLGTGQNIFGGDRIADFSPLQKDILGKAGRFADLFGTPTQVGTPLFAETGDSISRLLGGTAGAQKTTPQQVDEFFSERVADPAMRSLKQDILPQVDEGYTGGNFWSTARGKARDTVATDVLNSLTEQKAQLDWNINQQNQALDEASANRMLATVPQAMQYGQMPATETMNNLRIAAGQVQGMKDLFGIGAAEQSQEQMEIESQIAQFMEQNRITDPEDMAIILALLGMNYSSGKETSDGPGLGYVMASNAAKSLGQAGGSALAAGMGF